MEISLASVFRSPGWLWVIALFAQVAWGTGVAPPAAGLHPLVIATELLYEQRLLQPCDELAKLAWTAPGLTDEDRVRLHFVAAARSADSGDALTARQALAQALELSPSAPAPAFAGPRLRELLEQSRSLRSSASSPRGMRRPQPPGPEERERAVTALLRGVDALYAKMELEGARVVLELARSLGPSIPAERAQLSLRAGILRMEAFDEAGAVAAFREGLEADPNVTLLVDVPPKTLRVFLEAKASLPSPPAAAAPPKAAAPALAPGPDPRGSVAPVPAWGMLAGGVGLGLIAGGAMAGAVGFSSYQAEQNAAASGDWATYQASRGAARAAINVADGLYAAGAVAVGVGVFLWLRPPGAAAQVGASAGPGQASLVVSGALP